MSNFVGPEIGGISPEHTKRGKFIFDLKVAPSFPFKGLPGVLDHQFHHKERWIEFCFIDRRRTLIISTRGTDEFTNGVASSLGQCIARYHDAEYGLGE